MPLTWFKEFFEVTPLDMLSRLINIRIVNPNRFAQRFLRKAHFMLEGTSALLCDALVFGNEMSWGRCVSEVNCDCLSFNFGRVPNPVSFTENPR